MPAIERAFLWAIKNGFAETGSLLLNTDRRSIFMLLDLLKSNDLQAAFYCDDYQELSDKMSIDFSAIISVLDQTPLCNEGQKHAELRQSIANQIAQEISEIKANIPKIVDTYFDVLTRVGTVDIMKDIIDPLVFEFLNSYAGCDLNLGDSPDISMLFSKTNGMRKRREVNGNLSVILNAMRARFPDQTEAEIVRKVVIAVLGNDTTRGTLAMTLHRLVSQNQGRSLAKFDYPNSPNFTGLKYVDRVALGDTVIAGCPFHAGQEIRLTFDALNTDMMQGGDLAIFGAGRHVCLGKGGVLELWKSIVLKLSTVHLQVEVIEFDLRTDSVFCIPKTFVIRTY
jgi:cytochrome P450